MVLRMAAGLTPPQFGRITWHSAKDKAPRHPSQMISYQGHQDAFKANLTTFEELTFWAKLYGYSGSLTDVLDRVDLERRSKVPTGKLSAGQKRRLALARLLISGRSLWILDEPNAAMDTAGRSLTESIIASHVQNNGSVIIASHSEAKSFGPNARRLILEAVS